MQIRAMYTLFFAAAIALGSLCACSAAVENAAPAEDATTIEGKSVVDPAGYANTISSTISADYAYGNDIETLREKSDLVIEGDVTELTYTYHGSFAYTLASVAVTDVLMGEADAEAGDQVSVLYAGGYIPLSAVISAQEFESEDFSEYTDDEIANTVIREEYLDEVIPAVGDKAIFFLVYETKFPEWAGCYSLLCGTQAEMLSYDNGDTFEYQSSSSDNGGYYSAPVIEAALTDGTTFAQAEQDAE